MPDAKNQKKSSTGLTTKQIVNRHIQNKNDKITEDDMMNVKIDSSLPIDSSVQPLPVSVDNERSKDEDKDNRITIPWDVING